MKSILVLEDDENLRELLVDVLDSLDYRVEGAAGPEEALHLAHEIDFEVVISDVRMAGPVDGLGVLEQLKKQRPALRCIVMTGYADELAPLRALQIRVDDYLYKPFDMQDIVASLGRLAESAQRNQWFRKALGRLFGQGDPQRLLEELQALRERCLLDFFVAIRSNWLYAETALAVWDALEDLETGFLSAMRSVGSLTAESVRSQAGRYQEWQQRLRHRAANQELVLAGNRPRERVERKVFKGFLEAMRGGRISAEELSMAVGLRRLPAERRAEEYQEIWQRMWGHS